MLCLFASDLHGSAGRYHALWRAVRRERPDALFLGGDLLPHRALEPDFWNTVLLPGLAALRRDLGQGAPRVFAILGNDDPRRDEPAVLAAAEEGLLEYIHGRSAELGPYRVYGYAFIPPTPFQLKDWERYDVSRFVDAGSVSPEEGFRTVDVPENVVRYSTIAADLAELAGTAPQERAIWLFHAPPYGGALDRLAVQHTIEGCPLDPHVGSIAIRRFIERRTPLLTLHGHIHESARVSGSWRERIGTTHSFSAAHDGRELSLVRFDPAALESATRDLVPAVADEDPA